MSVVDINAFSGRGSAGLAVINSTLRFERESILSDHNVAAELCAVARQILRRTITGNEDVVLLQPDITDKFTQIHAPDFSTFEAVGAKHADIGSFLCTQRRT